MHQNGRGHGCYRNSSGIWVPRPGSYGTVNANEQSNGSGSINQEGPEQGRGKWITDEMKAEIAAQRAPSVQIGSETTDELLIAPKIDPEIQHIAHSVLDKDFGSFKNHWQARNFVHSLLVNLSNHHSVDTSGLLPEMAASKGRERLRELLESPMDIDAGTLKTPNSFQYIVLPLIGVLTRENFCQSALVQESRQVYAEVYRARSQFLDKGVFPCMRKLIHRKSMADRSLKGNELREDKSLLQVASPRHAMLAVVRLVYQLLKHVHGEEQEMKDIIETVKSLVDDCKKRPDGSNLTNYLIDNLERECQRLCNLVSPSVPSGVDLTPLLIKKYPNLALINICYDPPGNRHDNDHVDIKDIQLVPTQNELTCEIVPSLPSNDVPDAPHFLAPGWPRLLDTHFRLNREDMVDQLRRGINAFLEAWRKTPSDQHGDLVTRTELRQLEGQEVGLFAYDNIRYLNTDTARYLQGSIKISFDQPAPIKGHSGRQRHIFWERSKKRLMQGSLVCFVFPTGLEDEYDDDCDDPQASSNSNHKKVHLALGVVNFRSVHELARDPEKAFVHVNLTNHADFQWFISLSKSKSTTTRDCMMIQTAGAFFEAYRPILQALQTCEPGDMPFGRYLAPTDSQKTDDLVTEVDPPMYARAPGFEFDLSVLLETSSKCRLDVQDPSSCERAIATLQAQSNLDDTQSQALVEALSREVALISGPPGTGKTRIGVSLMQALLHNAERMKCGPIICICFTNHALDQFLENLLDQGVKRLVRIGSRSQSTRLHPHNLHELMKEHDKPFAVRACLAQTYAKWETVNADLAKVENDLRRPWPPLEDVLRYIKNNFHGQYSELKRGDGKEEPGQGLNTVDRNYSRWSAGADIEEMERENKRKLKKDIKAMDKISKSAECLKPNRIPMTNRCLAELYDADLWTMSMAERRRLEDDWIAEIRAETLSRRKELIDTIQRLATRVNQAYDEIRRGILSKAQVIGMTTSIAAKYQSTMAALSPKIIVCEEAGEVLESHILATLLGSIQHLILIGDHLQLRPQIATYDLSSDSIKGRNYNLDRSLFERLITSAKIPSSPLKTQRRMRPEICDLVRRALYSDLIDGEVVAWYPNVSGMATNLCFMHHLSSEDSRDQYGIRSFANTFEAEMVVGLVHHLIKNGYPHSSIAVLTPYLGQLSRLREKLGEYFRVDIDARDQEELDAFGKSFSYTPWKAPTAQLPITLRTVDNFQGEEADIVIISLVRSNKSDASKEASSSIGFLRSPNRTNVLLSRARHGMYLIGNAPLMNQQQNGIWREVMSELEEHGRVQDGFLLQCRNHPETEILVTCPDDFKRFAPNGGCTKPCAQALQCGHLCTMICHSDDRDHQKFKCIRPCPRFFPQCGHDCPKQCGQDCGDCLKPTGALDLPCGHILERAYCFQRSDPSKVRCKVRVERKLPYCEHNHPMACHKDINTFKCYRVCGLPLSCGHSCSRFCHECQRDSLRAMTNGHQDVVPSGIVDRTTHGPCKQVCNKTLHCGHPCDSTCHLGSNCPPCKKNCSFTCSHVKCERPCRDLCPACLESCAWTCSHQGSCQLPCGAPCSRLPCNLRCEKTLACSHRCPSVCGEKCPLPKYCVECRFDASTMKTTVDPITRSTLSDVDVNKNPIYVLSCGHVLAMSWLDRIMEMNEYYDGTTDKTTGIVTCSGNKPLPNREVDIAVCPTCQAPITGLARYGRRIKYSQLVMRLKKFEMAQNGRIADTEKKLTAAQAAIENNLDDFLNKLTKLWNLESQRSASRMISKTKIWSDLTSTRSSSSRGLGRYEIQGTMFPNSDVCSLTGPYNIYWKQEQLWKDLIKPALDVLQAFDDIREHSKSSPSKLLYEAWVSHFDHSVAKDGDSKSRRRLMKKYVRECDLLVVWQTNSAFVHAIQGRSNVLHLILHVACQAMERLCADSGAVTVGDTSSVAGWHGFLEDLLQCCEEHVRILKKEAHEGLYPKTLLCTNILLLDIAHKRMLCLGHLSFNKYRSGELQTRQRAVDEIMASFTATLAAIINNEDVGDQPGNKAFHQDCVKKARRIEALMQRAKRMAPSKTELPQVIAEKYGIPRVMQKEIFGIGCWYRCPSGHSYVIGDCDAATQENCPECGARVGDKRHVLLRGK